MFQWYDFFIIIEIGLLTFIFTKFIYPKVIDYSLSKGWVGFDIHKKSRPRTAEFGGIGLVIGAVVGLIPILIIYRNTEFVRNGITLIATIVCSAAIGFIDDRKRMPSLRKIVLMILCGAPLFLLNWFGYISVKSPTIPVLGTLRLTIIYPLVLPIIIAVMTNTVNMLEGYNGEGSGTCSIALFFMMLFLLLRNRQKICVYSSLLAAVLAFYCLISIPQRFSGWCGNDGHGCNDRMHRYSGKHWSCDVLCNVNSHFQFVLRTHFNSRV